MSSWMGLVAALLPGLAVWMRVVGDDSEQNRVVIRQAGPEEVEVEVSSPRPFPVVGALVELSIGGERTGISRCPKGDLRVLIFTLSAEAFARTKDGDRIAVRYNPDSQGSWDFGTLDKSKSER